MVVAFEVNERCWRPCSSESLTLVSIVQFKAAQYLRLAEEKGHKTVGNSW